MFFVANIIVVGRGVFRARWGVTHRQFAVSLSVQEGISDFFYHFDVKMRQKETLLTSTFGTDLFSETDTIINCVNFDPLSEPRYCILPCLVNPCPLSFSRVAPCSA